jgi:5S rRNA maturation endonuclease (ribonuclease M5)
LPAKREATVTEPSNVNILHVTTVKSSILKDYLCKRGLNFNLIAKYIFEVRYKNKSKEYYGIAFKNISGGYEVRNSLSKVCIGKKDTSIIGNNSPVICVFEGFIDFLSYICLFGEQTSDYIVLNSVSQAKKAISYCSDRNNTVYLYFDNDSSGDDVTKMFMQHDNNFQDMRSLYQEHKDLNDYLLAKKRKV